MGYRIRIDPQATSDLRALPGPTVSRVGSALAEVADLDLDREAEGSWAPSRSLARLTLQIDGCRVEYELDRGTGELRVCDVRACG